MPVCLHNVSFPWLLLCCEYKLSDSETVTVRPGTFTGNLKNSFAGYSAVH